MVIYASYRPIICRHTQARFLPTQNTMVVFGSLLHLAFLLPALVVALDTSSHCGQWDTIDTGLEYSILLDQWGASGATSGVSCASITSVSSDSVAWVNNWTWTGGTGVKSFTNIQLNDGVNVQLSDISSMPVRFSICWCSQISR